MATVVITFAFLSDAQSFTGTAGANSVLSWDGTTGNPAGALKSRITGKSKSNNNNWARTLTWETMGVPVGSIITGVTGASCDNKCTEFTTGASSTHGAVNLVDGATTIVLSNTRTFAATDAGWVTTTGTDKTGLSLQSTDSCTITINNTLATGNSSSAAVTLYQDQLTYTVTYTPLTTAALTGTSGTFGTGTLIPNDSPTLIGGLATFTTGTLSSSTSVGLSGSTITSNVGALGVSFSMALTGGTITTTPGALIVANSIGLLGIPVLFSTGTLIPSSSGGGTNILLIQLDHRRLRRRII